MASREKLLNIEIFKLIFRKVGWIGVLFQLLLLGAVAFPLFIQSVEFKNDPDFWLFHDSLFAVATELQFMIVVFVPLVLGMFLYNFLMNKKASVFMHSLPISRKSMYLHHTISGIALLVLPVVVTAVVSWIINTTSTIPVEIKELYVYLDWILIACSISMVMFSASTIVAMVSGNFIMQGALTFGILFLPVAVYAGVDSIVTRLFNGSDFNLPFIVPRPSEAVYEYSAVALMFSVTVLLISYFIYLRRDIENSSAPVVFKTLRPIFKYVVTILGLLITSWVIVNFATSTVIYFITLMIGSLIGYLVGVFVTKTSKLSLKKFIGFFVFAGTFTVVFVGLVYSSNIYETKVPNMDEIVSVTIQDDYQQTDYDEELTEDFEDLATFTDEESFKVITEIHQSFIDELPEEYDPSLRYKQITIIYTLDNGRTLTRSYNIRENREEIGQTLLNMPEFIENYCAYLDDTVRNKAESICIYTTMGHDYEIFSEDEVAFNGFIDALSADIEAVGLVGVYATEENVPYVHFDTSFPSTYGGTSRTVTEIYISPEYENTIKWFEENGYEDIANYLKQLN